MPGAVNSGAWPSTGSELPASACRPPACRDALGPEPRSEARSSAIAELSSTPRVGLTRAEGAWRARKVSKRMSRLVASITATAIITAPIAALTLPRTGARRSVSFLPPSRIA